MISNKTSRNLLIIALAGSLLLGHQNLLAGQVYKWTDEQGNIHYSDKKPNNIDSKKLKVRAGSQTSSRASAQDKSAALDEAKQKALEKKAEELQSKSKQDERKSMCEAIRKNLQTIEDNSRIRIEENGEQRFLTPEEIEAKKAKYQKQLDELC